MRLDDKLVDFVDEQVRAGVAPSRAAVVTRALQRERRRAIAARDAEIYARTSPDPGLDALARHASRTPLDLH